MNKCSSSANQYKSGCFALLTLLMVSACDDKTEVLKSSDVAASVVRSDNNQGATSYQQLAADFVNPPNDVKPLTWVHAMSSNMSAEGLTKDLEAISEAGLGGTLLFNVTQGIPLGNVLFNSQQHIDLIGHMAAESKRLGLSFGIHNGDGWTSSGGPWVTPEHSMKRLTFNQIVVDGGDIDLTLVPPPSMHNFYKDVAVLAYPALASEIDDAARSPKISASDSNFNVNIATNNNMDDYTHLIPKEGQSAWLQFSYEKPYTLRLVDLVLHEGRDTKVALYTSNDGDNFVKKADLTLRRPGKNIYAFDEAFVGFTSKHFRLVTEQNLNIKEVKLSSTPTMNNYLGRTSAARSDFQELKAIGAANPALTIQSSNIKDITADLDQEGHLKTHLPEGKWTIMRFGYTSTGAINIPASKEGTGLEVDKFSRAAFKLHYDNYVTNVINKVQQVAPNALHTIEIDSYEVGAQNWTDDYHKYFQERFGYSLVPYLPLFAGKFVDSSQTSEDVLWDTRELNNELITENYYGYFRELAHKDGIKTYLEPYGSGPFNELDVASKADMPMGEFWLKTNNFRISASSSAANIYNKPIVSAEAFTQFPENNWLFSPKMAKAENDKSWALGVNQQVFHRFAHQANTHVMPGMTMNRWGAHLDRTQPWWRGAGKAFNEYVARGQQLLRVGRSVADVLWYLGDATPTICPEQDALSPIMPTHLNYDCLNTEILQQLTMQNGRLTLPHGNQYKMLVLNNNQVLTFSSVEKIHQLAKQGAVIIGEPIQRLAGRFNTPQQQQRFTQMVQEIWSLPTTHDVKIDIETSHGHSGEKLGLHKTPLNVIDWSALFQTYKWNWDVSIANSEGYYFTHRRSDSHDIYFIYTDNEGPQTLDAYFNVTGKLPEIWDPKTGKRKKLGAFSDDGKVTRVPIKLAEKESAFVVFSQPSTGIEAVNPNTALEQNDEVLLNEDNQIMVTNNQPIRFPINGAWQVDFSAFYGLDNTFEFTQLVDWKDHPQQQIQDYSGTAVYRKTINVTDAMLADGKQLILDLGNVSVAASVSINDQLVGTTWIEPHQLDITEHVVVGTNKFAIEIANLWVNRLLADAKLPDTSGFKIASWQNPTTPMPKWYVDNQPPPASKRITFATQKFMQDDEPRAPSGLLGPVNLYRY